MKLAWLERKIQLGTNINGNYPHRMVMSADVYRAFILAAFYPRTDDPKQDPDKVVAAKFMGILIERDSDLPERTIEFVYQEQIPED